METKFIEGTNQQYSIREDGFVIRNYLTSHGKIVYTSREVKSNKNSINLNTINGRKRFTLSLLMKQYYDGVECEHCENKVTLKYKRICENCELTINTRAKKNSIKKVSKWYVAKLLDISIKELTEELYNHHKKLILFKRQLAHTHNISINSPYLK
jgi:hypothetical protein